MVGCWSGVACGVGVGWEGCRVGVGAWGGGGVSLFELGWWEGLMGEGNMHITRKKNLDTCTWVVLGHYRAKSLEHRGGSYRQKWLMGNHYFGFTHDHHMLHTATKPSHVYPVLGGRFRL